ncbi:YD repeat-containing protein [Tenacibaculum caenipelagi]|uniref:YD repeat-containing protein n=2 Tax=Tenacibaculum caenipelagi TaxID=1325435 RepID=A0A4R6TAC7_9FLAO|nr:YD repeat-containing protein [Tenacibaculum caenipelagi]
MLSIFTMLFCVWGYTQELPKVVPLSPNAASIAKYGEVPVGHFTGTPNIEIPLYTISSGDLSLPLSLSYHAGGNRVEDVASWVGLGWSLGTIPSISRSVRGLPDDHAGGFFSGAPLSTIYSTNVECNTNQCQELLRDLNQGDRDSEPDIFYYNIKGESGTFFYNQETKEFVTYPVSNTKIIRDNTSGHLTFKIFSQEGIVYEFGPLGREDSAEVGYEFGTGVVDPIDNVWNVTKITSSKTNESIIFNYEIEKQLRKFVTSKTKYVSRSGGGINVNFLTDKPLSLSNAITAQRLNSIEFSNGKVEFVKSSSTRLDLNLGYSLKEVIIKDKNNRQVKKFDFEYSYKVGSGTNLGDDFSKHWLILNSLNEWSNDGKSKLTHLFSYDMDNFPADRTSFAQDFWGYHNGQSSNQDLIPSLFLNNNTVEGHYIPGANRNIATQYSQFGILKKIVYPTGGYTEFDYENNQASDENLPLDYVKDYQSLAGEEYFEAESTIPITSSFTKTFTINNPPDLTLNNENPKGGAIVSFSIGNYGCDLSGGANPCALFTVTASTGEKYYIQAEGSSFYLPNGTYSMSASFNQSSAQYENFHFIAEWRKINTNHKYIGGLRIKEIRSYSNANSEPIVKKYKYTKDYNSTETSGVLFSSPIFNFYDFVTIYNEVNLGDKILLVEADYIRIRSNNGVQQVSDSGSLVGYATVIEETLTPEKSGITVYDFTHTKDNYFYTSFPYLPAESNKINRGQIKEIKYYKKEQDILKLIKSVENKYTGVSVNPNIVFALKTGKNVLFPSGFASKWTILQADYNTPNKIISYEVSTGWSGLYQTIEKDYFDNNNIITNTTTYSYENPNHLLKTSVIKTDSKGIKITEKIKYPEDITNPSVAVTELINQNRVTEPINVETTKEVGSSITKLAKQNTIYKDFEGIYLPEKIQTLKGAPSTTNVLEDRVVYHSYDAKGNPTEVSKADGTHIVYIWGYNQTQPIAKIENATLSDIPNTYIDPIKNASNLDDDRTIDTRDINGNVINYAGNEGQLRFYLNKLHQLTALNDSQITFYTYDPLIGVTSITDPRGQTVYYEYDDFNRLEFIKDADGNLLKENKYNYKN